MIDFLIFFAALGLIVQALIGLSYVLSSIWEKERRASLFGGLQFLGMLGVLALPHRLVVWFITRNKYARRLFSFMDAIFYGKKPKAKPAPKWSEYR